MKTSFGLDSQDMELLDAIKAVCQHTEPHSATWLLDWLTQSNKKRVMAILLRAAINAKPPTTLGSTDWDDETTAAAILHTLLDATPWLEHVDDLRRLIVEDDNLARSGNVWRAARDWLRRRSLRFRRDDDEPF